MLINLFLAFMFGGFVGASTGFSLKKWKVPNSVAYFVIIPVVVFVAFYCSWAIFLWLKSEWFWHQGENSGKIGLLGLLLNPSLVWWGIQQNANELRAIAFRGKTITSMTLWIGDVIEAVVILGTGFLSGMAAYSADEPQQTESNPPK